MRKYLLLKLLILLLVILLFVPFYEKYQSYDKNKILDYSNRYNHVNKIFKKRETNYVSNNSSKVDDIGILNNSLDKKYIKNFDKVIKKFNKNFSENEKFSKNKTHFKINNDNFQSDWLYYYYIDYTNLHTDFKIINKTNEYYDNILINILSKINKFTKPLKKLNIYKYKIINKSKNKKNFYYKLFIVFYYKKIYNFYYTCDLEIIIKNNDQLIFNDLKLFSTDIFDIEMKGYTKNTNLLNDYFNINIKQNNNINYDEAEDILNKKLQQIEDNIVFKTDVKCFDIINNNLLNLYTNNSCELKENIFKKNKRIGVLDRPCTNDNECKYFKANKNYDNNFGKCINNYCELPSGFQRLGYHFKLNNSKPLCYNCISETNDDNSNHKWLSNTELGNCCDEQDKTSPNYNKKYDFLKSPDYHFNNDIASRLNYDIKQKFKKKNIYYSKKFDTEWNWYTS